MEDTVTTTPVPGGSLITPVLVKPKKELMTKQRWNKTWKRAGRKEALSAQAAKEKVAAEQEREAGHILLLRTKANNASIQMSWYTKN
jgi:hypothetical protein